VARETTQAVRGVQKLGTEGLHTEKEDPLAGKACKKPGSNWTKVRRNSWGKKKKRGKNPEFSGAGSVRGRKLRKSLVGKRQAHEKRKKKERFHKKKKKKETALEKKNMKKRNPAEHY